MKIPCIIVEDEPKAMRLMQDHVEKTPFLQLEGSFYTSLEALDFLAKNTHIELVFLDINLPQLSGLDAAYSFAPHIYIIFTTAYSDFAVKSYEVNTIDYLLKPITYNRFFQAVSKARKVIDSQQSTDQKPKSGSQVFVKSGKKIVPVNWNDILYIEALKEYVSLVSPQQKIVLYKRMSEIEQIQPINFVRIHNSYSINLDKIEKVEDNLVHIGNRELPVSKSYKDSFYEKIRGLSI
ncbi:MAG TPA: LytTR family DNA-binding domain-containing protein [Chitinophagaceae bacterium]|nr:LytTR family DNA-binding domain-containing protein [Chitinophagaceae bacterium]